MTAGMLISHKLDRLARNRADDVEINRAFEDAGVRLVSTSENIDQTPGGMLLHGIMRSSRGWARKPETVAHWVRRHWGI